MGRLIRGSVVETIMEEVEERRIMGRSNKTIVLSNPCYSSLKRELRYMGIEGKEIDSYIGLKVVVVDQDDILVMVG